MKELLCLGFFAAALGWASMAGASEARVICDASDPANKCPGADCMCVPDSLEIVFDATSTGVYEYAEGQGFPLENLAVTVYFDTKTEGVQGWSYGVIHDLETLDILDATTEGTDAKEQFGYMYFDATSYNNIQRCVPGTQCRKDVAAERSEGGGWISGVVLSLLEPVFLETGKKNSIARATYTLKKDAGRVGTKIEFSEEIALWRSPPVRLELVAFGKSRVWTQVAEAVIRSAREAEICTNGADDDRDGLVDCDDPDCAAVPPCGGGGLGLEADAAGSTALEDANEVEIAGVGAEIEATFFVVPVGEPLPEGAQGWSMSVEHPGRALEVLNPTTQGTDAAALVSDHFERTEVVDPARNDGRCGFVSAVVLSLNAPAGLDPARKSSVARARYRTAPGAGRGEFPAVVEFKDGLRGAGQPVPNVLTVRGETVFPAMARSLRVRLGEAPEESSFVRGDANDDGRVNISDAIWVVRELVRSGPKTRCEDAADANDDGLVDLSDAQYLIQWRFLAGPEPPAPFGACGPDSGADALSCPKGSVAACP